MSTKVIILPSVPARLSLPKFLLWILGSKNYDGEVSVSLKNESTDDIKQVYRLTVAANGASSSGIVPEIVFTDGVRSPRNINKVIEISDDKEIAVWGYVVQKDGSSYQNEESIEESAKKASWAFVLKISMNDEGGFK